MANKFELFKAELDALGITMTTMRETVFFDAVDGDELVAFKTIFINTFKNDFGRTLTIVTSSDENPLDILWTLMESHNEYEYPDWTEELTKDEEEQSHVRSVIDRHERELRGLLGFRFEKCQDIVFGQYDA